MLLPCCTRRAGPVTFLWALMMFVAAAAAAFVLYGEFFGTMSIPPAAARAQAGCSPRDRVVFLKTHKCASSTVQNLLLRRGIAHGQNVALPRKANAYSRTTPFRRSNLWGTASEAARFQYDLFCCHTVYHQGAVEAVMGARDKGVAYVSILRDPVELFISIWDYYRLSNSHGGMTLEQYINQNKGRLDKTETLYRNSYENTTAVDFKIREIEAEFDLIMVAERFDESMVLLADLLCWDLEADMSYLKTNARGQAGKSEISEEAREELGRWVAADMRLYRHFEKKFQAKILAHGQDRMAKDLKTLQRANERVEQKCNFRALEWSQLSEEFRPWGGKGVVGLQPFPEDPGLWDWCRLFSMEELSLLDEVRAAQERRAREALEREGRGQFLGFSPNGEMVAANAAAAAAADLLAGMRPPPAGRVGRDAVREALGRAADRLRLDDAED